MTRATTIIALTGLLVAGAAATGILGRDNVPALMPGMASRFVDNPVSNREGKNDRLPVATLALASLEPPQTKEAEIEPLRPTGTAASSPETEAPRATSSISSSVSPAMPPPKPASPKPQLASKPAPQKSYALLSDAQIAGIKERLKLSSSQEYYWPAVETALRAVARKIHVARQADPNATGVPIDPDGAEVQQLKSAAMPLLFQLREDQKREVRALARLIGLEKVAAQI